MKWIADIVDSANAKLDDRYAAVGPSYFMRKDSSGSPALNEADVIRIWKHNVLPYIEERLYGENDRLKEFILDNLRNRSTEGSNKPNEDGRDEETPTEANTQHNGRD